MAGAAGPGRCLQTLVVEDMTVDARPGVHALTGRKAIEDGIVAHEHVAGGRQCRVQQWGWRENATKRDDGVEQRGGLSVGMDEGGGRQGMERQHGTARGGGAASAMCRVIDVTSGMESPRMSISVRSALIGSRGGSPCNCDEACHHGSLWWSQVRGNTAIEGS